jgi:hypothetical protein
MGYADLWAKYSFPLLSRLELGARMRFETRPCKNYHVF